MIERKTWSPTSVKSGDAGQVTARFSVFGNIDSDNDVIVPGAFDGMIGRTVPLSAYGHQSWSGTLPIGKGVISATAGEAIFTGEFFDTAAAQDTRTVLAGLGELGQWSFGLDVTKSEPGKVAGQRVRLVQELKVWEVSPVLLGANPATATLAVKSTAVLSPAELATLRHAQAEVDAHDAHDAHDTEVRTWLRGVAEGLKADLRVARWCADLSEMWGGQLDPIGDRVVSPALRALAETAARKYAKQLKTAVPQIVWAIELGGLTVHGAANLATGTIVINAGQDRRDVWTTVAHEVGHLAGWNETQCRAFEQFAEKEYVG